MEILIDTRRDQRTVFDKKKKKKERKIHQTVEEEIRGSPSDSETHTHTGRQTD